MPRPRFDLADRLEHQAGNVENDGHLNAARYMREAAAVLRADDDTLYIRADIVEAMAEALDGLVQRFDTFDGQPFVNPADSPWSIARAAIAAYREASNDKA